MQGTVLANWLQANYMPRIIEKCTPHVQGEGDYGFFVYEKDAKPYYYLDGGCGLQQILKIASAIGLDIERINDVKGNLTDFLVEDTTQPQG